MSHLGPKATKERVTYTWAAGDILIEEFLNVDFYSPKLIVKKASGRISKNLKFRGHDFRRKLPFKDGSFEGVFSEHTLEHLDPWHAKLLLSEIKRVLKPGSYLRIVVPNLELFTSFIREKFLMRLSLNFLEEQSILVFNAKLGTSKRLGY